LYADDVRNKKNQASPRDGIYAVIDASSDLG
jgi:hypothetical protein